ncbi:hypothetical protein DFJ43DRAFT_1044678 [Lentinula guzmanii]|uniref:Uncharacterized protein n=1 Tax=Lentinula guzmanii TaxID=2804957 RepID=A0AA38JC79_9AGAR|nr:hypothetical protein DFJ43DRAFT_1044678 [Lentinula guzmanii]
MAYRSTSNRTGSHFGGGPSNGALKARVVSLVEPPILQLTAIVEPLLLNLTIIHPTTRQMRSSEVDAEKRTNEKRKRRLPQGYQGQRELIQKKWGGGRQDYLLLRNVYQDEIGAAENSITLTQEQLDELTQPVDEDGNMIEIQKKKLRSQKGKENANRERARSPWTEMPALQPIWPPLPTTCERKVSEVETLVRSFDSPILVTGINYGGNTNSIEHHQKAIRHILELEEENCYSQSSINKGRSPWFIFSMPSEEQGGVY